MGLKPATVKFNLIQRKCGQCGLSLRFPYKEKLKSTDRYREIRQGYCDNPKCRQYRHWLDVEFIICESVLELGHKYFDDGNFAIGYTATGVASDATQQLHSFIKSKKKQISDYAIERRRKECSERQSSRLLKQFETEEAESVRWRESDKDQLAEIKARVVARRKIAEGKLQSEFQRFCQSYIRILI